MYTIMKLISEILHIYESIAICIHIPVCYYLNSAYGKIN